MPPRTKATLIEPTVSVILVNDITIPVDNVAYARPVKIAEGTNEAWAYRVFLKTGGHVDLANVSADGFASLLAGAAF